jgi:hypothetical protein
LPATPCVENLLLAIKPQRGVIRLISVDYALSGFDECGGFLLAGRCQRCPALLIIGLSDLKLTTLGYDPQVVIVLSLTAMSFGGVLEGRGGCIYLSN